MKRPSFQFYPADWNTNSNLLRCSWAAQGAWVRVLCLLHDSDEYGLLRWTLKEMAQAIGAPVKLLTELAQKGVLKGADKGTIEPYIYVPRSGRKNGDPVTLVPTQAGPLWYSSRMVRDEYVRQARGYGAGLGDGNHDAPKPSPKGGLGVRNGDDIGPRTPAQSSSSSSSPSGMNDWLDERGREPEPVAIEPEIIPNDAHALAAECARQAGVPHISPSAITRNVEVVDGWLKAGIDPAEVILPTVRRLTAASGEPISSLRYFDREIRHEHARRKATLAGAGEPRAATDKPLASGAVLGAAAALDRLRGGVGDVPAAHVEH